MAKKSNKKNQHEREAASNESFADKGQGLGAQLANDVLGTKKAAELPDEAVELAVDEDRTRLILQAVGLLALNMVVLLLGVLSCMYAEQTGQIVFLAGGLIAVPVVWFVSKRMGRFFGKFFKKTPAIEFYEKSVVIYPTSDVKDALTVGYKDIKNYKLIRQGKALRLLMAGAWVKHPSGYYFVDINRPFMAGTLDELGQQIAETMRRHRVNERK